jgi:hypothetical protein
MGTEGGGEPPSGNSISAVAKVVAVQLQEALVSAHQGITEETVEASLAMEQALTAARQRVAGASSAEVRQAMREAMRKWEGIAAKTMGVAFLNLIDVGSVADVVLVAFTWPHTGSRRYCYAQSIAELSEDCNADVPTIVAAMMTNIDETIAGGNWLADYEFVKMQDFHLIVPTW